MAFAICMLNKELSETCTYREKKKWCPPNYLNADLPPPPSWKILGGNVAMYGGGGESMSHKIVTSDYWLNFKIMTSDIG